MGFRFPTALPNTLAFDGVAKCAAPDQKLDSPVRTVWIKVIVLLLDHQNFK